jgi:hypothetical protein
MIQIEKKAFIARHGDTQYRFPRMQCDDDGKLFLFYRVGLTHMKDTGGIAMRTSTDRGESWSDGTLIHVDPEGFSANNVVECFGRDGSISLFISRYDFAHSLRRHMYIRRSDDGGESWSSAAVFDSNTERASYYMTDVIRISDGLLGSDSTFALPGVQPCHNILWHSADDGRTWDERSVLLSPDDNLGDEVALLETEPGKILLILRHRPRTDTLAFVSDDGGRSWGGRRSISSMVGVLQRPLLRRLRDGTIFLSGRDFERKAVVAFISHDDGRTFGDRCMVESYQADGAYTGAAEVENGVVVLVYYSDKDRAHCPDLLQAVLRIG